MYRMCALVLNYERARVLLRIVFVVVKTEIMAQDDDDDDDVNGQNRLREQIVSY